MSMAGSIEERRVVIRGLIVPARIGAYEREKGPCQPVRIDVALDVAPASVRDRLDAVVSYDDVIRRIRKRAVADHVQLAETLADRIADDCLDDSRIHGVRVRVEKTEAVADAEGVGAEVVKAAAPAGPVTAPGPPKSGGTL